MKTSYEIKVNQFKFQLIQSSALAKKPMYKDAASQPKDSQQQNGTTPQPRPGSDIITAGFEIGTIKDTHIIAVNKFCYARPHVMLVTADGYRRQHEPLDRSDLEAAWSALTAAGDDYVVIYNCGKDASCSRKHKHMQLMPMPQDTIAAFLDNGEYEPAVPFKWAYQRLDSDDVNAATLVKVYNQLLEKANEAWRTSPRADSQSTAPHDAPDGPCPHNVILTTRWVIVIPRRQAAISTTAGANALGMLGVIAVATQEEADNWIQLEMRKCLQELGVPRS